MIGLNDIRIVFLLFFEWNDYEIVFFSLFVFQNDFILLFINVGMVFFKNVFIGIEK